MPWSETAKAEHCRNPDETVAGIILIDQFSRQIHRGSPQVCTFFSFTVVNL